MGLKWVKRRHALIYAKTRPRVDRANVQNGLSFSCKAIGVTAFQASSRNFKQSMYSLYSRSSASNYPCSTCERKLSGVGLS